MTRECVLPGDPVSHVSTVSRSIIRVASVPASHVYVRHLDPIDPDASTIRRLPDVRRGRSEDSPWWPPVMLDADWVRQNASEFDLLHLHFGFDAHSPSQLQDLLGALREHGKPLLYTVHDLRNPHHESRELHDQQLDVLVPGADRLVTLTTGAADEIARRWNREALVLPHPHVVDWDTMQLAQQARARRAAPGPRRIGVHVKSKRASMNPLPVLQALDARFGHRDDTVLQVNGHCDLLTPEGSRFDAELFEYLSDAHRRGRVDLRIHNYFSDDQLWSYLASLDVSVLPYRFGTHSGWLEACRDLGTAVVAPRCGYYADQGPVFGYEHDISGLDPVSLGEAVEQALADPPPAVSVESRRQQRAEIAQAHAQLYRELIA